ncbi:MAG: MFS transporter [Pirellulales bacterium]
MNHPAKINRSEWSILLILAAIQFTNILDFVIVMPLAPSLREDLEIDSQQFGLFVSSYGFASFFGTIFAAKFLDRYGRKRALLALYLGFSLSTLYCGLAPSFNMILTARAAAGVFGGVLGAAVMAIVGDVFADYRRGTAMGIIMSAFAVASVMGVPIGLLIAESYGTQTPFTALAGFCFAVLIFAAITLPDLPAPGQSKTAKSKLVELLTVPSHLKSFAFTATLVCSSFMVIPYLADAMVANAGVQKESVKYIYLVAGSATFVSTIFIGRLSDRIGKQITFRIIASIAILMMLAVTNLPQVPLAITILVCTGFMVFTSGRMVPAQALITGSSLPAVRGGFLSLNTAVQSIGMGAASFFSSFIIGNSEDGKVTGYWIVGLMAAVFALFSIFIGNSIQVIDSPSTQPELLE